MEEEGSEKICVHEEDEEEEEEKEEDVQGGGRVAEEGMYLFLHCWKGGGCLQLGWFGSCCKKIRSSIPNCTTQCIVLHTNSQNEISLTDITLALTCWCCCTAIGHWCDLVLPSLLPVL